MKTLKVLFLLFIAASLSVLLCSYDSPDRAMTKTTIVLWIVVLLGMALDSHLSKHE